MTRPAPTWVLALVLAWFSGGMLIAQQPAPQYGAPAAGPAPSRYAPGAGQQPAAQTGQPVYGPAPAGRNPAIRTVAGEEPIRQPVAGQQPAGQLPSGIPLGNPAGGPGPAAVAPANPQTPEGFPLQPAVEQWVDQVLMFWEQRSNQVKTFKCQFKRWDYDPIFGPKETFKSFASGTIQYASPDKGLYRVESLQVYTPPKAAGEQPQYLPQGPENGEHWVCNGESVFEFDTRNKRVVERALPPDMKGRAIVDGPLPFLFGARAETIKARYWIRPSAFKPPETKGEFWLEAYPKSRHDAQNFKMVLVVLEEKEFLPLRMQIFAPNFDPARNPSKTVYQFDNREANAQKDLVGNLAALFQREFYNPKVPSGWTTIKENAGGLAPGQAQNPTAPLKK